MLALFTVILISYLLGSIPSSVWVGKALNGVDVREHGSGNAGATNTFRVLGFKSGAIVVVMDFLKGFSTTFWISAFAFNVGVFPEGPISPPGWDVDAFLPMICGFTAMVGHMFPLYAGFRGGKGVLTACGMLYGIEPVSISITLAVFLIVMFASHYVSLASILGSLAYPSSLILLKYVFEWNIDGSIVIFGVFAASGIIYRHRANIKRLMNGTENRVSSFRPRSGQIKTKAGAEA
jgi:glycerol-3-phosphate acyltransferase PlsY